MCDLEHESIADESSVRKQRSERAALIRIVLGLGLCQIISWGTIFYPPAVVATDMGQSVGFNREAVFYGITLVMLVSALSSVPVGVLVDRFGSRTLLMAGSLLTAAGLFVLSGTASSSNFWMGWALLGIAAPLTLTTAPYAALVRAAGKDARRAVAALTLFSGLSSTLFYPLTQVLNDAIGWRGAYLVFALMHVAVCLPLNSRLERSSTQKKLRRSLSVVAGLSGNRASIAFWVFVCLVAINTTVSSGLTLHLIRIFGALGLGPTSAVAVASLTGPSQVGGRLLELLTASRLPPLLTTFVAALLQLLSFVVLVVTGGSGLFLCLFAVIYGVSNGLMTISRVQVPLVLFGSERYGRISGKLNIAFSVATAVAPVCFAEVLKFESPQELLLVCLVCAAVTAVLAFFLSELWRTSIAVDRQSTRS